MVQSEKEIFGLWSTIIPFLFSEADFKKGFLNKNPAKLQNSVIPAKLYSGWI